MTVYYDDRHERSAGARTKGRSWKGREASYPTSIRLSAPRSKMSMVSSS